MNNPFDLLDTRLINIENLLLDLKREVAMKATPKEEENLITVAEAAIFLSLSRQTLYNLVSLKEIPYIKKRHRVYFYKKELKDYLESGRHRSLKELDQSTDAFLRNKKSRQHG